MVRSLMNRSDRSIAPLSRVFEQFFEEPHFTLMPVQTQPSQPGFAMDLSEDDQNLIVRATLPGFTKDELNIEVDEGVLTISAEHNEDREVGGNGERFYRRERRHGSVQRRIALPMPVQESEATAELTNGVLTLKLPKVQKAPARKISIGEASGQPTGRPQGHSMPAPKAGAAPKSAG